MLPTTSSSFWRRATTVVGAVAALSASLGCTSEADSPGRGGDDQVIRQRAQVVATLPHDTSSYTQGLVVAGEDSFYESTGLRGSSSLLQVTRSSGEVTRSHPLPSSEFGEGLAQAGDRLIQLTWTAGVAHVYDAATFEEVDTFDYDGEGWGLCFDGEQLVMSNGSDELTFRDPDTFRRTGSVKVTLAGAAVDELNELECVEGTVYANVYRTDQIVQIDPTTGAVLADIDASGLLSEPAAAAADVLNGIAWDPASGAFYLTGKLWPSVFQVEFVPA